MTESSGPVCWTVQRICTCKGFLSEKEFSLYLHIPFCFEKCDYCDFYSVPVKKSGEQWDSLADRYIETLLLETKRRLIPYGSSFHIPSIYIGGGNPALLGASGISRLLNGLLQLIDASPREITIEANPETITQSFLHSCSDSGITRLSLGLQSFDESIRKASGRQGTITMQQLYQAAKVFGRCLSFDLISGLPGQDEKLLLRDIEKAISLEPGHISLYALTLEPGTPLAQRYRSCEDTADRLWLLGRDALIKAGYKQYEISNFALAPAYQCIHNVRYWTMKNWIGIGPSASGTIIHNDGTGCRFTYPPNLDAFLSTASLDGTPAAVLHEELDKMTMLKETILMGYRCKEGPDPGLFSMRFGKTIQETIPKTLAKWQNYKENTIMNFLNNFLLDVFLEVENNRV